MTVTRPASTGTTDRYLQSYLLIRTCLGALGILLPLAFIVGERWFLGGGVGVRGSISAYYHSSVRDVFVGGLCVIGFLLITYLAGQLRDAEAVLSTVAGVAVLGVVAFPTTRAGLVDGAPRCGTEPEPAGCSPVQQWLGESLTAGIHFACAAVFILGLALISFRFAHRREDCANDPRTAQVQRICGGLILLAVAIAVLGGLADVSLAGLTPLYVGEVLAIWAFGVSWLLEGEDIGRLVRNAPHHRPAETPLLATAPTGSQSD